MINYYYSNAMPKPTCLICLERYIFVPWTEEERLIERSRYRWREYYPKRQDAPVLSGALVHQPGRERRANVLPNVSAHSRHIASLFNEIFFSPPNLRKSMVNRGLFTLNLSLMLSLFKYLFSNRNETYFRQV